MDGAVGHMEEELVDEDRVRWIQEREAHVLDTGRPTQDDAVRLTLPTGETRWVSESRAPILGVGDEVHGIVGIVRDVTERERFHRQVELFHAAGGAVLQARDTGEALRGILQAFCRHAAWTYGEAWTPSAEAGLLARVAHHRSADAPSDAFERQSRGRTFRPGEGLIGRVWTSGEPEWLEDLSPASGEGFVRRSAARRAGFRSAFAVPVRDAGETLAVLGFFSFRREAEDRRLLATMSLVGSQIGNLVRLGLVHRGASLTRQLLTFSRRQPQARARVDLREVLRSTADILPRVLGEDVRLDLRLGDRPLWIDADAHQIEQVVLNLAINGRDAMPAGGVLTVSADTLPAGDVLAALDAVPLDDDAQEAYVRLVVRDTGAGMDEETLRHVFEPFYTTKAAGGGTGLGLATAYAIVRKHDGFLHATSDRGQGSEFSVYLPLRHEAPGPRTEPESTKRSLPHGGREWILVVEDEPVVRSFLVSALESLGYRVSAFSTAVDTLQALAGASGSTPDLLVTDMRLPDQTGAWLYRSIAERRPGLAALFVSGYPIAELPPLPGDPSLLLKPFSVAELGAAVRKALDRPPEHDG